MSIFGTIMSKIFHSGEAQAAPAAPAPSAPSSIPAAGAPAAATTAPAAAPAAPSSIPAAGAPAAAPAAPSAAPPVAPASIPAAGAPVDVAAVLDGLAAKAGQRLDWKHSIVDLLKLLDLDSSLSARKALAEELHYSGDTSDSASMNIWLHKQVMTRIAANGGTVPAELRD